MESGFLRRPNLHVDVKNEAKEGSPKGGESGVLTRPKSKHSTPIPIRKDTPTPTPSNSKNHRSDELAGVKRHSAENTTEKDSEASETESVNYKTKDSQEKRIAE